MSNSDLIAQMIQDELDIVELIDEIVDSVPIIAVTTPMVHIVCSCCNYHTAIPLTCAVCKKGRLSCQTE